MNIKHDCSYIGNGQQLIEKGFAEIDIHSLNFDRFYTEEQKAHNYETSFTMSNEERNIFCDRISKEIHAKLLPIVELLNSKYKLYQYNEDISYNSNWDLFFYSNKGWNGKDYFDYMKISFNEKRTVIERMELMNEVVEILKSIDVQGIQCSIQYSVKKYEDAIHEAAKPLCKKLEGQFINYGGTIGKIKEVQDQYKGNVYAFFKKGAKTKGHIVSDEYLVLNFA